MGVQPNVVSKEKKKTNKKKSKKKQNMGEIGVGGWAEKNWWYL